MSVFTEKVRTPVVEFGASVVAQVVLGLISKALARWQRPPAPPPAPAGEQP